MNEFDGNHDLEDLLQEFPFKRQASQKEKLAKYFLCSPGMNKLDIQKETGISQPTIRKIQKEFLQLSKQQRIFLIQSLSGFYKDNLL